jgi:uncharacterized protein (TIGR03000 family)
MLKSMLLFAKTGVLATAALLMSAGPSLAQRGHGAHGGGHASHSSVGHAHIGGARFGGAHISRGNIGGRHFTALGRGFGRGFGGWGRGYGAWGGGYGGWGWAYPYYYGGYGPDYSDYYAPYTYTPDYLAPSYAQAPTYQPYYPSGATASAYNGNTASVDVVVPAPGAILWFNGQKTAQTGTLRHFVTPPLTAGQNYVYEVRASWMVNGQPVTQTQQIQVQPGQETTVRFPQ